jgi:hypothetical protein
MSTIQEKIIYKNKVVACLKACGVITGKYMNTICPDESSIEMMMTDGTIRKIVVEVRKPDKTKRKIFLFELFDKVKPTQFPTFTEEDAKKFYSINEAYFSLQDSSLGWFDRKDIKNYIKNLPGKNNDIVPDLMFFSESGVSAVYARPSERSISQKNKELLMQRLEVSEIIEYLY